MPRLYFASPRDLAQFDPQPGVRRRIVPAEHATVAITDLEPKTVVATHKHPVEQVGIVTRGSLVVIVAGEQRILGPGDTFRVPAGSSCGIRAFEDPVQIVGIWAPPRADGGRAAV